MTRMIIAITPLIALLSVHARAEQLVRLDSGQAYYVSDEATEPSPSDIEPPSEPLAQDDLTDYGCGKKAACCQSACGPWQLYPRDCRGYEVGGWVQMGYHTEGANGNGVGFLWNFPKISPFNNYPNVVQLQQAWVYAEKVAQTGGCGTDWGFRVDYLYGTDAQDLQAYGNGVASNIWDNSWDAGGFYGHALPQLYGEVAYNNLKLKAGKFFTIVGYEKAQAPENFFYSHSYSFLVAPYTHTGALVEYTPTSGVKVVGGWAQGWDTGFEQNGGDMFLGGVSVKLSDRVCLTYATMMGDFGFAVPGPGSDTDAYFHSVVLEAQLTDRLQYVCQSNYMENNILATFGPTFTINQYAFYTVNCQWALGARAEWYHGAGSQNELSNFTVGANYRPNANVVVRPEVRLDVLNEIGLQDSTVFGVDAIVRF